MKCREQVMNNNVDDDILPVIQVTTTKRYEMDPDLEFQINQGTSVVIAEDIFALEIRGVYVRCTKRYSPPPSKEDLRLCDALTNL